MGRNRRPFSSASNSSLIVEPHSQSILSESILENAFLELSSDEENCDHILLKRAEANVNSIPDDIIINLENSDKNGNFKNLSPNTKDKTVQNLLSPPLSPIFFRSQLNSLGNLRNTYKSSEDCLNLKNNNPQGGLNNNNDDSLSGSSTDYEEEPLSPLFFTNSFARRSESTPSYKINLKSISLNNPSSDTESDNEIYPPTPEPPKMIKTSQESSQNKFSFIRKQKTTPVLPLTHLISKSNGSSFNSSYDETNCSDDLEANYTIRPLSFPATNLALHFGTPQIPPSKDLTTENEIDEITESAPIESQVDDEIISSTSKDKIDKIPESSPVPSVSSSISILSSPSFPDNLFKVPKRRRVVKKAEPAQVQTPPPLPPPKEFEVYTISSTSEEDEEFMRALQTPNENAIGAAGGKNRKKRKTTANKYVAWEAGVVSSREFSSDESESELDTYDSSFVITDEDENTITETQQVRYIESTKDVMLSNVRDDKVPLHEIAMKKVLNSDLDQRVLDDEYEFVEQSQYVIDTFCVDNGEENIEYDDIGCFTQAMNMAREELANESESERGRKNLRSRKKTLAYSLAPLYNIESTSPSSSDAEEPIYPVESDLEEPLFPVETNPFPDEEKIIFKRPYINRMVITSSSEDEGDN